MKQMSTHPVVSENSQQKQELTVNRWNAHIYWWTHNRKRKTNLWVEDDAQLAEPSKNLGNMKHSKHFTNYEN